MRLFFASWFNRRSTRLFRAVSESEYDDILSCGRFRNPDGFECKYFARTRQQAETYASLAIDAYGEGPFLILEAAISTKRISSEMCANVENGIEVIIVATDALSGVSLPKVIGRVSDA